MKKLFSIMLLGMFLISFASAVWWNPFTWGTGEVVEKNGAWYLDHLDGIQLEHFDTEIQNLDNGKAKICLLPKTPLSINDEIIQDSKATLKKNNIETRIVQPSDMEVETEAGKVKKMCVDVDFVNEDSIRFGSNSALFEYTNESIIAYDDTAFFNDNYVEMGKLSISTDSWEYKNGKPNIEIGRGEDKLTHTFYIENYTNIAITNLRTVDMNTNLEVERNATLKYLSYVDVEVPTYKTVCNSTIDVISGTNLCYNVQNGTTIIQERQWNSMDSAIEGENYIVSVFVNSQKGDYVDIDFDYYGTSVLESPIDWGTYAVDDLTNLKGYYAFEDASSPLTDSHTTGNDLTVTGSPTYQDTGKINFGVSPADATERAISSSSDFATTGKSITITAWVKYDAGGDYEWIAGKTQSADWGEGFGLMKDNADKFRFFINDWDGADGGYAISTSATSSGTWYHLVGTYDGTTVRLWQNGVEQTSDSTTENIDMTGIGDFYVFGHPTASYAYSLDGTIDEVGVFIGTVFDSTDVATFYNSGNGYSPFGASDNPPTITGFAPANGTTQTTTTTVNINATVYDDINLASVKWNIDGVNVSTNSSGTNNTLYNYQTDLTTGLHNYTMYATDNASQVTATETRYINISISTPEITLQSPADNAFVNNATQELIGYVESEIAVANVSLYVNSSLIETNSSGLNATNYSFLYTFPAGTSTWYFRACNNMGFCANSLTRTLNEDLDNVTINATVLTPIIYSFGDNATVNLTVTDSFLDTTWYSYKGEVSNVSSLWLDNDTGTSTGTPLTYPVMQLSKPLLADDIIYYTTSGTDYKIVSSVTCPDNTVKVSDTDAGADYNYTWWCSNNSMIGYKAVGAVGTPTIQELDIYRILSVSSGVPQEINITSVQGYTDITFYANHSVGDVFSKTVSFAYDTIAPNVSITSPISSYGSGYAGLNVTLNATATDATNLDSCWYSYNGINTSIPGCLSGVLNSTIFQQVNNVYTITVWANDTVGNEGSATQEWSYAFFENNQTFNSEVIETQEEDYQIVLTYDSSSWLSVVPSLVFEADTTTGTTSGSGDILTATASRFIPEIVGDSNKSFYWSIALTNLTGTYYYNSTTQVQNVTPVNFELCNLTDNPQLYFETFSVSNPTTPLNATFESAWTIRNADGGDIALARSFEDTSENASSWAFCIEPNTSVYTVSIDIVVDAANYTPTTHYIVDTDYNGSLQNVSLYLLNDDLSTLTQIKVTDQDNKPVEDVYVTVQRYDVGTDTYYTVSQVRTDSLGLDLTYLNWYDTWYKFIGVYNGNVAFTDGPKKVSSTPQAFQIGEIGDLPYEKFGDISYSLTYNDATENFVLTYVDPTGLTSSNCLRVIKRNATADYSVCKTCQASSSATIYCNTASAGNGTFIASYYATGSPAYWIDQLTELKNAQNRLYEELGNDDGTGLAILIAGVVTALFLITPALGVLGAILGMLAGVALGFQPLDYTAFLGIVVVGGAIAWAVQK